MAAATFANMKTFFFPHINLIAHASVGVTFAGFKHYDSFLMIVKGFLYYPFECFQLNPLWRLRCLSFSHASGEWPIKILRLPINSWNQTDDQTPTSNNISLFGSWYSIIGLSVRLVVYLFLLLLLYTSLSFDYLANLFFFCCVICRVFDSFLNC